MILDTLYIPWAAVHVGLVQVVPHGDGGGPVILLGSDQSLAKRPKMFTSSVSVERLATLSAQYTAPST